MSDEERKSHSFPVTVKDVDPNALITEILLQIRASVEALVIITAEDFAEGDQEKALQILRRHEKLREDLLLEYAFKLQDRPNDKGDMP